jgi:hypothetical protein
MNNYNNYMTMQDMQGIAPVMQNTQGQQSSAQQALQQGQLLGQQALGTPQQMQLANALRQNKPNQPKSDTDFLTGDYTPPSIGINPNAKLGYDIDSMYGYGLK